MKASTKKIGSAIIFVETALLKINLGCGEDIKEGLNVDCELPNPSAENHHCRHLESAEGMDGHGG
jgi:hypothetical protein